MMLLRVLGAMACAAAVASGAARGDEQADKEVLTKKLWPRSASKPRSARSSSSVSRGSLSNAAYQKRKEVLRQRLAGTYQSQSLSVNDPPLNFIQNGGFEKVNKNSAKDRSRWLWWGGWSWGGDYENSWEDRPEYVHSGQLSARIRCTGQTGRIGISTAHLPAVPGPANTR